MSLTPTQESALISELVDVIERFHASIDDCPESYEARVTQPSPEHLIMALRRWVWNSPPELGQNMTSTAAGGMTWTAPRF